MVEGLYDHDQCEFFESMRERWIDYMVVDEIACPRRFVCGEPLERRDLGWENDESDAGADAEDSLQPNGTTSLKRDHERQHIHRTKRHRVFEKWEDEDQAGFGAWNGRGPICNVDDRNRIYTEALIYMPHSYFVNDHRQGFREEEDLEVERLVSETGSNTGANSSLTSSANNAYVLDTQHPFHQHLQMQQMQMQVQQMQVQPSQQQHQQYKYGTLQHAVSPTQPTVGKTTPMGTRGPSSPPLPHPSQRRRGSTYGLFDEDDSPTRPTGAHYTTTTTSATSSEQTQQRSLDDGPVSMSMDSLSRPKPRSDLDGGEFRRDSVDWDSEELLTEAERLRWRKEEIRRLKMRNEIFPWLREDTVIFANFNQLYKIDPNIFKTWMNIIKRVPNSILWLLRFPPAGENHLRKRARELVGDEVAKRLVFTDVAPKHLHIHRGRVADVFLDTPECNAHTTAADILWSGTPVITYPKYDYKMCSRVAASIAYATGEWDEGTNSRVYSAAFNERIGNTRIAKMPGYQPGLRMNLDRLDNDKLLGHHMVVNSYEEYEERAVQFGMDMQWGWKRIMGWKDEEFELERRENGGVGGVPSYSANIEQMRYQHQSQPWDHQHGHRHSQQQSGNGYAYPPSSAPAPHIATASVANNASSSFTPFHPSRSDPTHIYVPFGLAARLRRRLFLTRDTMPLFDTNRWVQNLERGMIMALDKWEREWNVVMRRNELECAVLRDTRCAADVLVKYCEEIVDVDVGEDGEEVTRISKSRNTRRSSTRCFWINEDEGLKALYPQGTVVAPVGMGAHSEQHGQHGHQYYHHNQQHQQHQQHQYAPRQLQ
ncbi:hypothetical protein HK102_003395 [Quaeritorhiza haematococci]|nr:hypothetical protein HK102_003395 [Quaeritorhiza haematococci]